MTTITAIYQNGVFRPTIPVHLPEGTAVEIQAPVTAIDVRALAPPDANEELIRVYECLSQSYDTGVRDAAARHNEHQP